jgi:aspartyl-tRNA(Asn)/glutamyl-tRNA(Gln) amidotransferase subunit C
MSLSIQDVERIARLARLQLSGTDAQATVMQLNGILDFVEQLQAVDTSGIEPMTHAVDVVQRLRPDVVSEVNHRTLYQSVAPETEAGLYLVPKVIE